jgi:hypothetical protein
MAQAALSLPELYYDNIAKEFQKRRGYDPIPFLPTLTGRIIGSSAITERFLWDWRRTIADLFADGPLVSYTVAVVNAAMAAMAMNVAAEALGVASVMLSETGRSGFLDAGYLKEKLALLSQSLGFTKSVQSMCHCRH